MLKEILEQKRPNNNCTKEDLQVVEAWLNREIGYKAISQSLGHKGNGKGLYWLLQKMRAAYANNKIKFVN